MSAHSHIYQEKNTVLNMLRKIILITFVALMTTMVSLSATSTCYARLEADTLRMGNALIERVFAWNQGAVRTLRLTDRSTGETMPSIQDLPDFVLAEEPPQNAKMEVIQVAESKWTPEHMIARITYNIGNVQVRRDYRLYDNVPAIAVDTYVKGEWDITPAVRQIIDQIYIKSRAVHCNIVEFHDSTDVHNTFVEEHKFISYHHEKKWNGNLLLARDYVSGNGLFILKEAPCSEMQVGDFPCDFITRNGRFQVTRIGFAPEDILPDQWTRLYGSVMGVTGRDELSQALALRAYQKTSRRQVDMVMMNTWGDRGQDGRVCEEFCMQELDKAARLGITVYQIDDGWQAGKSPASVMEGGSFSDIWKKKGYWDVDPVKFPDGLSPIVEKAKRLGMEIGLWFNPSVQDELADWEKDAAVLIDLYKKYGIRNFKIDGLVLPTQKAERNLRWMLDRVREETDDEVIINMDLTNGRRVGYHWFTEYGNIFLENRYTDWGNYYPYKTLRNIWQLSRYVAPERLQVEFLNPWRNQDKYYDGDIFTPSSYSFDYVAATSFAGQPLAWMEASNLPEDAYYVGALLKQWYTLAPEIHKGAILPIGEEPSGRSWTGFQSITDDRHGYLIVYRELTPDALGLLKTWFPAGAKIKCKALLGSGTDFTTKVDADGRIKVSLRQPNSFAIYEYTIVHDF